MNNTDKKQELESTLRMLDKLTTLNDTLEDMSQTLLMMADEIGKRIDQIDVGEAK